MRELNPGEIRTYFDDNRELMRWVVVKHLIQQLYPPSAYKVKVTVNLDNELLYSRSVHYRCEMTVFDQAGNILKIDINNPYLYAFPDPELAIEAMVDNPNDQEHEFWRENGEYIVPLLMLDPRTINTVPDKWQQEYYLDAPPSATPALYVQDGMPVTDYTLLIQ